MVQLKPDSSYTAEELRQIRAEEFYKLYFSMAGNIQQAYNLALGLQHFDWFPFDSFSWASRDKDGVVTSWVMAEILPPTEAIKPLATQCDKCNALATKVWLEDRSKESHTIMEEMSKLTISCRQTIRGQLAWELAEATSQTQRLKSDTQELFADTQRSLSMSTQAINKTYLEEFQDRCTEYTDLLDEAVDTLKQAKQTAYQLRCWQSAPLVTAEE